MRKFDGRRIMGSAPADVIYLWFFVNMLQDTIGDNSDLRSDPVVWKSFISLCKALDDFVDRSFKDEGFSNKQVVLFLSE